MKRSGALRRHRKFLTFLNNDSQKLSETWSVPEMDMRLAKLGKCVTQREKRILLRKWSNEAYRRGIQAGNFQARKNY